MPINVRTGSTIAITATFFSSAGILTVPTSATVTITYPPSSNSLTTVSCSIRHDAQREQHLGSNMGKRGLSARLRELLGRRGWASIAD